ncbi:hypothetical protein [Deinococcus pimensis]|uniref:hypothetical protein n=1 Tax=Deinococcus pimensis TaxID=309888 RepID=UPI0004832C66|nr:hypothetical protein [Deinococcus pimensis]
MRTDYETAWQDGLTDEQRALLVWLERHKCRLTLTPVGEADGPNEELLLEVQVDQHALVRERGRDLRAVFDRVAGAARTFVTHGAS